MRWLDDVEEDLRKMRISGWTGKARRRDEWKCLAGGQGSSKTVAPYGTGTDVVCVTEKASIINWK
jgi:hypothetical protein